MLHLTRDATKSFLPLRARCLTLHSSSFSFLFPLCRAGGVVKPFQFCHALKMKGNMPFCWLPCQLSAYGVGQRVTDFFSRQQRVRLHTHTLDPLSSQRLVDDASIVVSHIRAKANMVSAAGVCATWSVCVCVCVCFS